MGLSGGDEGVLSALRWSKGGAFTLDMRYRKMVGLSDLGGNEGRAIKNGAEEKSELFALEQ